MRKIKEIINKSTPQTKILITIIIVILILLSYVLYTKYNSGKIDVLMIPYKGASIFLDNKKVETTTIKNQTVTLNDIHPGKHSILVYLDGHYPWSKTMYVKKGNAVKMYPFMMPTKSTKNFSNTITILPKNEIVKIKPLFKKQDKNNIISKSGTGNIEIKKEDNNILVAWIGNESKIPKYFCSNSIKCKKVINIFSSKTKPIKSIGFYPERENIIIFSVGNSIYAIDINKNGTQNFQPIYTGDKPYFKIDNQNSTLYIKDGELIFSIKL